VINGQNRSSLSTVTTNVDLEDWNYYLGDLRVTIAPRKARMRWKDQLMRNDRKIIEFTEKNSVAIAPLSGCHLGSFRSRADNDHESLHGTSLINSKPRQLGESWFAVWITI
jgi:hypothetical protein